MKLVFRFFLLLSFVLLNGYSPLHAKIYQGLLSQRHFLKKDNTRSASLSESIIPAINYSSSCPVFEQEHGIFEDANEETENKHGSLDAPVDRYLRPDNYFTTFYSSFSARSCEAAKSNLRSYEVLPHCSSTLYLLLGVIKV